MLGSGPRRAFDGVGKGHESGACTWQPESLHLRRPQQPPLKPLINLSVRLRL